MTMIVGLFLFFLLAGMPAAFAIGLPSLLFFIQSDFVPISVAVQRIAGATQSFPLLAVPFFVLAGNLMNVTGITPRLIKFSTLCTGWIAGGLAHVCILLSAIMGGVSGAAVADAAMEARILGPTMIERGFSKGYTAGVIALGSLITATIPPSIGLILYGYVGNVSIGRLFIAGIVPGFMMAVFLMLTAWLIAKRRGYQPELKERPKGREVLRGLNDAKWAILFPVFLIAGIRFGIFTPSEAGAFCVLYALIIGVFVYREMTWKAIWQVLEQSVGDIGMIMLIIMLSSMLGYAIIFDQVPQKMSSFMVALSDNPTVILFMILGFLVISGMFVESTVLVLLLTPIFVPVITHLGIDPVHFGILMMSLVTMGSMTPPVGVAMFTVCGLLKCSTHEYVVESMPFAFTILGVVTILVFIPDVVLFLPRLLM
jgi:tripartite ATP-independent transporter DctM subunit